VLGYGTDFDLAVVETGPEQIAAFDFDCGRDPGAAVLGMRPDESAVPRRALGDVRMAAIGYHQRQAVACSFRYRQLYRDQAAVVLPVGSRQGLPIDTNR